jgi:serralysin
MATVTDITTTPTSGLNYIDALLDTGPDWNYLTPAGNTLYYTFSVASGNESGQSGQVAFTLAQQAGTRTALDYISKLTGIQFKEVVNGADANIHLCNVDLQGSNVTGLCSWHSSYSYSGTQLVSYEADAYVYLDNVEWFAQNHNLTQGTYGYETLLHELGHALGLKHPFDNSIRLPLSQDNTSNTLMSYTSAGGAHSTYSQYDIAALNWLYGGDGLGGALGINSTGGRYITGTSGADTLTGTAANDKLEGDGGNDMIDGGNGFDTAVFRSARSNYAVNALANGDLTVTSLNGIDGTDTLHSIEQLQFADMSVSSADVASDNLTLNIFTNKYGYYPKTKVLEVNGKADLGTTVKIYDADTNKLLATKTLDKYGMYSATLDWMPDGVHKLYATETDAAGNVLLTSKPISFTLDTAPPVRPTYSADYAVKENQVTLNGTGEAGSTIVLMRTADLQQIAHTTVGAGGTWHIDTSPLLNGAYTIRVTSIDFGENGSNAATSPTWNINSALNMTGTAGNDTFKPGAGNNAVDGGGGLDTAVYAGTRAGFTVQQGDWGFDIFDNAGANGHDALINVERIKFDDLGVAIDETAASLYRLYSAAFGRPSDAQGMGYWIDRMDTGAKLSVVSREFMVGGDGTGQAEFDKMYGKDLTDTSFVTQLYHNVLGRDPDAPGFDFWMSALINAPAANKVALRAQLLIDFSDSPENIAKVVGQLEHGVDYIPVIHG